MKRSLVLIPVLIVLAGCASPAPAAVEPAPSSGPISLDNCGFEMTVDAAPERVVTIKSTSTELMLALGLEDRIIGTAFQDGPVPASLGDADLPVIAERMPSEEALLDLEPDFVFAGWESAFTADTAGDRGELAGLGIGSYVSPAACKGEGYRPAQLSFDDVFSYIEEAGDIFGVPAEAADLVASQKNELEAIETDDSGKTALWWSSGTDTPYVGGGIGAPQMIMDTLGLANIGSDLQDSWSSLNWEAIIAANPDVIVLVDASWNTADSKKAYLAGNPATANLDAVKNEQYLVIPFAAGEAGVRNVSATADLADQLGAL